MAQSSSIRLPNSFTESAQPRSLSGVCGIDKLIDSAIATRISAALAALTGSAARGAPGRGKTSGERLREVHA
jgi:hypothetical protein